MTPARIATVVVVAAMVSFGSVASARHEPVNDPKDTRGRLDVAAVRLRHDEGPPQWGVVTFGEWTVAQMWDVGYVVVELDTRADAAIDFRAVMRSDGRRLVATLYQVRRDGSMRILGPVPAGKAGARAAAVRVPLHKVSVGSNRTVYRWSVATVFTGASCSRPCIDRVPDSGTIEQPLPGITPSPTPSPTPPPTPSPTPPPTPSPTPSSSASPAP